MGSATLFSFGTLVRMNQRFFFNDTDTIAGDNFDEVRLHTSFYATVYFSTNWYWIFVRCAATRVLARSAQLSKSQYQLVLSNLPGVLQRMF